MAVFFVYGTLTDPDRVASVLECYRLGPPAICEGLERLDGRYPTLAPGRQTRGRLLETPEIDTLDSYEGLDRGLYCRVSIPLSSGEAASALSDPFAVETANVYVGNPQLLGLEDRIQWPSAGEFEQQLRDYLDSQPVVIRPDFN